MWEIQIYNDKRMEWTSICPSDGKPYQYNTKEEAWDMLNKCYPDVYVFSENKRVIEIVDSCDKGESK